LSTGEYIKIQLERRGPGRGGERKVLCQVAVRKLEYSGVSVAWFLGMTTSSVNRMARLEEMMELDLRDK